MRITVSIAVLGAALLVLTGPRVPSAAAAAAGGRITEGSLIGPEGQFCPLKHTDVQADISGPLARVRVTQQFQNTFPQKIEAVYCFPLPPGAAVDEMTMTVGERTIRGVIKRREEARALYDAARRAGHVAALLDQERPNIFTQAVANIEPGVQVRIAISYVETVPYQEGRYDFRFPMVVGPRYIPGAERGKQGGGWSPDTDRVPDASRITPLVTPPGTRAGHDLSLAVSLDAGAALERPESPSHDTAIERPSPERAVVRLRDKSVIPNKDFILRYAAAARGIQDAVLAHRDARGGFFTLLLQPPQRVAPAEVAPRELVFVLDTSGSMTGFPIEKAKEAMRLALDGLDPRDTFNLITFSGDTHVLFPQTVPATPANLMQAREFLMSRQGSGGTGMMKAIRAALAPSDAADHVRVVCFMTDGEVGNDLEILDEVQRHPNARVFAFGIGSSVNHFLLDGMARYGRGEVEYVGLNDDGSAAARRFQERVRSPLLTDISVDWGGLPVSEVYPKRIPDLFAARPVVLSGRYSGPASGVIRLRGTLAGHPYSREVRVSLPAAEPAHDALATLWARRRVESLMGEDLAGMQRGAFRPDLKEQVTQLGLAFRLMTPFTSFVAVEDRIVTSGGEPQRVEVPVEMPDGMSYEGVFGSEGGLGRIAFRAASPAAAYTSGIVGGVVGGVPARLITPMPAQRFDKLDPLLLRRAQISAYTDKLEIRVFLSDLTPATLQKLRQAGLEVLRVPPTGTIVTGRIEAGKLAALAQLDCVRYAAAM